YTCAALLNRRIVGVIMARNTHQNGKFHVLLKAKLIYEYLRLMLTKDGRKTMKIFAHYDRINEQLYEQSGKDYDGEIVLFVVSEYARGKGLGKELFQKAKQYLKQQGSETFYLYTDKSCNYQFYEHSGMRRNGEKKYSMKPYYHDDFSFFLYEDQLV
ncbi:MAG: N-acetyltransferase, partial [Erysipelotrichia bacterium]|nr:N-acetyltransferase [Erysipelotrichia bacterium]